jgi:HB1, ASXL, restriction endonuclease HTH domain
MRAELEHLIAEGDVEETGAEAAALLVELIRLEGRARRLLEQTRSSDESRPSDLAGLTLHDAARVVLEEEGRPLHARELGERIKARGWRHPRTRSPRPDQIVYQLAARLPKHPQVFRRVAPQTFALASWESGQPRPRQKPHLGIFRGPGLPIAREIGERPEAPFEDEA